MKPATPAQVKYLTRLCNEWAEDEELYVCDITKGRARRFEDLTVQEASEAIDALREEVEED